MLQNLPMYNHAHHQRLLGSHRLFAKLCQRYLVETMELYVLHGCTKKFHSSSFLLSPSHTHITCTVTLSTIWLMAMVQLPQSQLSTIVPSSPTNEAHTAPNKDDANFIQPPSPVFVSEKSNQARTAESSTCSLHSETLGTAWITVDERGGIHHHYNIDDDDQGGFKSDPRYGGSLPSPWLQRLVRGRERMRWVSGVAGILVLLLFISCIVFWVTSGLVPTSTKYSTSHAQGPPKQQPLASSKA